MLTSEKQTHAIIENTLYSQQVNPYCFYDWITLFFLKLFFLSFIHTFSITHLHNLAIPGQDSSKFIINNTKKVNTETTLKHIC